MNKTEFYTLYYCAVQNYFIKWHSGYVDIVVNYKLAK